MNIYNNLKKAKISAAIVTTAILIITMLATPFNNRSESTASAAGTTIQNNTFWKDTSGNPIYSQGGGVFNFGGTYYWYGVHYKGAESYYKDPSKKFDKETNFVSVTCYSSKDLVNWKFENDVLTPSSKNFPWCYWFGRLGVCYNAKTRKYVLIAQHNESVMFASCGSPTGNFVVENIQDQIPGVLKAGTGDQTVFIDDNGTPYIICSNKGGRGHQYVVPLRASDYLAAEQAVEVASGSGREGNCLFKYKGKYYFCASDLHGWNASHSYVMWSDKITGPYNKWTVMDGTDADFSHVTQTGFFVTVKGSKQETVIFCGDRWSDFAGNGIGYNQWCPLSFSGDKPYFHSLSQWNLNASTGEWSVGVGNNYILNPSFDADRVSQQKLAGWNNSGTGNGNASGARTGRFCMQQWSDSAFKGTMSQDISLPNGTYTLKAWAKSSGGQKESKIYINGYGGSEKNVSIKGIGGNWKEVTISDIKVTTGKCQVGIYSDGNAGNWVKVDDFSLIGKSDGSSTPVTPPTPSTDAASFTNGSTWRFKNVNSGLYMQVEGAKAENNANIQQWGTSDGNIHDIWKLIDAGDGYYYIASAVGDGGTYMLDIAGRKTDNGTNADLYKYNGNDNQKFKFTKNADGSYKIRTKITGDKSAVEVKDALKDSGANVQQWEVNGANCQDWILEAAENPGCKMDTSINYEFKNVNSGMVMDIADGKMTADTNVRQWESNGADCQKWKLEAFEGGGNYYYLRSVSDNSYALKANGSTDGGNVNIVKYADNDSAMLFKFSKTPDGTYYIMTRASKDAKLVEVDAASKEMGANIQQWSPTNNNCQKWSAVTYTVTATTSATTTTTTTKATTAAATTTNKSTTTTETTTQPITTAKPAPTDVIGDINGDGNINITDAVALQKWLIRAGDVTNPKNADLNDDGKVNVFDLIVLIRKIKQ